MQTSVVPNSVTHPQSSQRFDWGFFLACALCALPALVPTYPAMVDIPQHAAQIQAIKGIWTGNWKYADLFQITYLTPYWIGYILSLILSTIFGPVWGVKLVVAAALACIPWCAWKFVSLYSPPSQLRWILIPIPFGFAYEWGFLNFLISIPIGFLTLKAILSQNEQKIPWWRGALWVHLLFFAHILTAAMFCSIASFLMMTPWKRFSTWFRRMTPQLSVLPILFAYIIFTLSETDGVRYPVQWGIGWHRFQELVQGFIGGTTLIMGIALSAVALSAPWLLGAKPHRNAVYLLPFGLYIAWMMLVPNYMLTNFFNYQRFGFVGYPLYLICFNYSTIPKSREHHRPLGVGLLIIALAMIGFHVNRTLTFDNEIKDYELTISHADPGKRMLIFAANRYSAISRAPLYLHLPLWYQAEKGGLVDLNFASMNITVGYKDKANYPIQPGFEWYPLSFDWQLHQGDTYDYFIFHSIANPTDWINIKSNCKTVLISQRGAWWLFARTERSDTGCTP
jgi:hypothetical protein